MTRAAFDKLVMVCHPYIKSHPITPHNSNKTADGEDRPAKKPRLGRRIFNSRDIVAMTLKYMLSVAEMKDIHVQFGATLSTFRYHVAFGKRAIIHALIDHPDARLLLPKELRIPFTLANRMNQDSCHK